MNKTELRREAYLDNMATIQAKRLLETQAKKDALDKRKKYDWNGFLQEYLPEEQQYMAVTDFFIKVKKFDPKNIKSKWFKLKTRGWRQMKEERIAITKQIIKAQNVAEGFNLVGLQQLEWIKIKARTARNITTIFKVLSKGVEEGDVNYEYMLKNAKNLSLLQKMGDEVYRSTDEFLKNEAKAKLEAEEEGISDVDFDVS